MEDALDLLRKLDRTQTLGFPHSVELFSDKSGTVIRTSVNPRYRVVFNFENETELLEGLRHEINRA